MDRIRGNYLMPKFLDRGEYKLEVGYAYVFHAHTLLMDPVCNRWKYHNKLLNIKFSIEI